MNTNVRRKRGPYIVAGVLRVPTAIPAWELELVQEALSHLAASVDGDASLLATSEDDHAPN
ncbi:hypothetical protein LVJ94_51735 [Pendulispora rubella]|uniref:Uncharacterized protein n=1 Tax=Pendulispora rubella TaxID=2741070 RepID=A0ABZ2L3D4_9BACT